MSSSADLRLDEAPDPHPGIPGWIRALIALCVLGLVAFLAMVVLAVLPVDLKALEGQVPAFADTSRRIVRAGCGLTERRTEAGCREPAGFEAASREIEIPTTTKTGPKSLKGTLSAPARIGPRPAVVLVHGSGPATREGLVPGDLVVKLDPPLKVFEALAAHLTGLGFVVVRYDKRSCRACYPEQGPEWLKTFAFTDFAEDAKAALDFARGQPEVDPKNLIVVGHSQGAAFIPDILEGRSDVVTAVWLAGFSGSFKDALLGQLKEIGEIRGQQYDQLGKFIIGLSASKLAECFSKLESDFDPDEVCIGGGVRQAALKDYQAHSSKTRARLNQLGVPALFVQGTLDRNAPKTELHELRKTIEGDVELRVLEGMTHALTDGARSALSPTLLNLLRSFLASVQLKETAP